MLINIYYVNGNLKTEDQFYKALDEDYNALSARKKSRLKVFGISSEELMQFFKDAFNNERLVINNKIYQVEKTVIHIDFANI